MQHLPQEVYKRLCVVASHEVGITGQLKIGQAMKFHFSGHMLMVSTSVTTASSLLIARIRLGDDLKEVLSLKMKINIF